MPLKDVLTVAAAQIAPVILRRRETVEKVAGTIDEAATRGAQLVAFGEVFIPGYPFWIERTDGARFEGAAQKALHAVYLEQAVSIPRGDLAPITEAAKRGGIAVIVGIAELAADRGGQTIYCTRVFIDAQGRILSMHRKLMPTHEERLAWGVGDGAGLVTHSVGPFTVGALNCWENWMPLARTALYAAGEDLHVAIWPGSRSVSGEITRFIALESCGFVVSVSGLIREADVPTDIPMRERMVAPGEVVRDGGTAIAGPDGAWIVEPVVGEERLVIAELDYVKVREARQTFDPVGHYSRPDVLRLTVDRRRPPAAEYLDDG